MKFAHFIFFFSLLLVLHVVPTESRKQKVEDTDTLHPPSRPGGGIGSVASNSVRPIKHQRKRLSNVSRETRKLIKQKNKEAISMAQRNDLRGAAKIFEEVVKLSPKNSQYLNNLAVTYMRMKLYHLAERVLRRARKMNRNDPDPIANLKELQNYLPHSLPYHPEDRKQVHHTRKFKRIPYSDFHLPKYDTYRRGLYPFVLTGAIDHWQNAFNNWSFKYFLEKYPNIDVEHYSRSMVQESVKPTFTSIKHSYRDMKASSKWYKDKPGVYVQWNLNSQHWREILEDAVSSSRNDKERGEKENVEMEEKENSVKLPDMFKTDDKWFEKCFDGNKEYIDGFLIGTHWRMLLIGSDHAGMFNHRDILRSSSFQAQLVGSKRWHLCGPSQDEYLYKAGDIDTFNPDYEDFPKAKHARCLDDWVVPGEMIFYGRDWWHHTEVLSDQNDGRPSISITGTLTDENNYGGMITELSRECGLDLPDGTPTSDMTKRIFMPPGTCKNIDRCFKQWEDDWGKVVKDSDKEEDKKVDDVLADDVKVEVDGNGELFEEGEEIWGEDNDEDIW